MNIFMYSSEYVFGVILNIYLKNIPTCNSHFYEGAVKKYRNGEMRWLKNGGGGVSSFYALEGGVSSFYALEGAGN